MAVIACPDCGGKLSTMAASCPHCGYVKQNESRGSGVTQLTTTQATSKALKGQSLAAGLCIVVGIIGFWSQEPEHTAATTFFGLMIVGGFAWWVITKFKTWWHHS